MKKFGLLILTIFSFLLLFTNCKKSTTKETGNNTPQCVRSTDTVFYIEYFTDSNINSAHYNQLLGSFTFFEITVHYSGTSNCPQDSLITTLSIANSLVQNFTVAYDFYFASPTGILCGTDTLYRGSEFVTPVNFVSVGEINESLKSPYSSCSPFCRPYAITY